METVYIKGKIYRIDLVNKRLINVKNSRDKIHLKDDNLDHFRSIVHAKYS